MIIDTSKDIDDISYKEAYFMAHDFFYNIWYASGLTFEECNKLLKKITTEMYCWEADWLLDVAKEGE